MESPVVVVVVVLLLLTVRPHDMLAGGLVAGMLDLGALCALPAAGLSQLRSLCYLYA